ncbi:MAG: AI-2E family transporter [Gemmatimonadales bacterium]|nr:AI-2E family transporter [Gemmatimonadales bacterium]
MTSPTPGTPLGLIQRWALPGIFIILAITAMRLASALLLPVAVAALFALLLAKPVRWLVRRRVPTSLAAGVVVFGTVIAFGTLVYLFATPAASWIERAPRTLTTAQVKINRLMKPIEKLQRTAEKVEEITSPNNDPVRSVKVAQDGLMSKVSGTTLHFLGSFATVIFLSFFLLAQGERFREKVAEFVHRRHHSNVQDLLRDMQAQMSTFLLTAAMINVGVGLCTYGALLLIGMPNPGLWGVVAGVFNFLPYIGAIATMVIIGLAGLVSFDAPSQAFMAVGAFFAINLIEANIVTPTLMGRRLPLNPVAVFLGFLFWGWVWGITGAVLAVPLTVMVKVIVDRIPSLEPLGVLLDS